MSLNCLSCNILQRVNSNNNDACLPPEEESIRSYDNNNSISNNNNISNNNRINNNINDNNRNNNNNDNGKKRVSHNRSLSYGNMTPTQYAHSGPLAKIKAQHRRTNSDSGVGPRLVRSSGMRRDWSFEDLSPQQNDKGVQCY
ncbi:hypothetical protein LR48_Vigan11g167900 [Vigna angularis]|uniref:Uncharacterized protein n=2 Tax=Phaseolus angularis TaxID=3914 RepID=A0A0L9VU89_PHAAN|nr:uncharacterized protein LOC128194101 [Vigna angularis]KAG2381166.1 uncharacterized protein HKW66_Vig0254830 [Vigna angularis]KOM58645.1 hypothetical protein LR48_Vigan11g167900 [Vigna angularis]BAT96810.1 hypothetical protein VIGAN_09011300 [Vigna angularis var. angularis]